MLESPFYFQENKPIRWGVIGCGKVTEKKSLPAYQKTADFQVDMVMGRNKERVLDYAKRHKVPGWTTDSREIIENPNIDAVYIATPPDSHKFYALQVAKEGKPCCIEKPMSPNYQDSLAIYEAFAKKNVPLFIAYYRRSLPRFLKVKQWLDENRIGEVSHIRWKKTKLPNDLDISGKYNWRTDKQVAPGGYFDDLASHGLDLFSFLLGEVKEVSGEATNKLGLYSAYDMVSGSWKHENGVIGEGIWNFGASNRLDKVEILGTDGTITFSVLDEAPIELKNSSGHQTLEIPHPEHVQQYHVQNIKNHLVGKAQHPSIGKSGLHTSWIMDKILGAI